MHKDIHLGNTTRHINMRRFARFDTVCTILKKCKTPMEEFRKVAGFRIAHDLEKRNDSST